MSRTVPRGLPVLVMDQSLRSVLVAAVVMAGLPWGLAGCGRPVGQGVAQATSAASGPPVGTSQARASYAQTLAGVREAYDVVLENLAHAQTPGYRAVRPEFGEHFTGRPTVDATRPTLVTNLLPGQPMPTGRWLDLAIKGGGYLVLDDPYAGGDDGLSYTRDGRLFINARRELVQGSPDGPRLEPRVVFPDQLHDLQIREDGMILAHDPDSKGWVPVGQLHLARFHNAADLRPVGEARFAVTRASGPPLADLPGQMGLGTLRQGHLEGSNVNVAEELKHLRHLREWGESLASAAGVEPGFGPPPPTPTWVVPAAAVAGPRRGSWLSQQ